MTILGDISLLEPSLNSPVQPPISKETCYNIEANATVACISLFLNKWQ